MKAFILTEFGGIDKLVMKDLPEPTIGNGEVLVEVKAISINPVDVKTRAGSAMAEQLKDFDPLILGWDISGVVKKTAKQSGKFKAGDEVFGMVNFIGHGKCYAEYVAAPENHLALKPVNITHEEAAAATLAALTPWQLFKNNAELKRGKRIMIQAASGGVGHFAVQIAKHLGAYVIGVSSAKNSDFVLGLGANEHIGYDEKKYKQVFKSVDYVIDAISGGSLFQSLKAAKTGGKIFALLPLIGLDVFEKAKEKRVDIHYSLVRSSGEDMEAIADLLEKGIIKSRIFRVYPFEHIGLAHLEMETGRTVGKIIVKM